MSNESERNKQHRKNRVRVGHLQVNLIFGKFTGKFTEFKLISTTLKSKFYVKKNILFVFAENDFQDFILVFKNENKCKKVYDLIYQKRIKEEVTNEEIYQRFLFPIFNENSTAPKLLIKWMNKLEKRDKEFYIEILKNDNIFQHIYTNGETSDKADVEKNGEKGVGIQRKRRFCKANMGETTNDDKENNPMFFDALVAENTKTNVYAKIDQNEALYLQNKQHVCTQIKYSSDRYFDLKIINKPNYQILENTNTKTGKVLIIFNPKDRTQCHEFRWENATQTFLCRSCRMNVKVKTFSKEKEYVELPQLNHKCPFRPYFKFNNFVLAPDFEFRTKMIDKRQRKNLIIFDANDKTKCFIYYFHSRSKLYICTKCKEKRLQVSAK
uniref:Uncharacterized protein n=1 Tax=Panagrolaimus sp. PS1159 TaxID=55785 RepID=A0AC35GGI2_9BILA